MLESYLTLVCPARLPRVRARRYGFVAVLLGLAAAILSGELLLWVILPPQDRFYVWPPHFTSILHPNPEILVGISGESRFQINSSGLRGGEFSDDQKYRILAIGGSTTECLSLDETEVWTRLLQDRLSAAGGAPVWVGNAGRSGRNTRHHILQLKYLLPQLPRTDAVLILAGVNDLHVRISDLQYDPLVTARPTFEEDYMRGAFAISPPALPDYHYKRLGWWRVAKKLKETYLSRSKAQPIQDSRGEALAEWRRYRKNAEEIVDTIPDLTAALEEYRRNLNTLVDFAEQRAVRPILVTQPTFWGSEMTKEDSGLLWMGGIGSFQLGKGHKYYSATALDKMMRQYNETMLDVCRHRTIDCIDLARALPKDRTIFYDDVHFNEAGSRRVAEVLFQHIAPYVL